MDSQDVASRRGGITEELREPLMQVAGLDKMSDGGVEQEI